MPDSLASEKRVLLEALRLERSKKHVEKIAGWVLQTPERLDILMDLFFGQEPRHAELAAWVVGTIGQKKPAIFLPWFPEMISVLQMEGVHGSLKRNVLRILQETTIPENLQGYCADVCFKLLANPQEEIAVRAFSMGVLAGIYKTVPEIGPELRLMLEQDLNSPSSACRNRAQKVLSIISK